jgi:anti-sigma factor RsiW
VDSFKRAQTRQGLFERDRLQGKKYMHAVVMESLEEFLAGTLEPAERRAIEAHLGGCGACRDELQAMEDVNLLFGSLRTREAVEPPPGFYARLMQQVGESSPAPAWSSLFFIDPVWGRRLVFSCLLLLAAMGTYLVSTERSYVAGPMPDAVMAQQNEPSFDSAPAPESMLVTLANYEH